MLQRPLARPLRQGDLDGLCGVYAIVNAFCALCPELDDDLVQIMFAELIKKLKAANAASATEAIYDGIDFETLLKIAKPMAPWLTRMTNCAVPIVVASSCCRPAVSDDAVLLGLAAAHGDATIGDHRLNARRL